MLSTSGSGWRGPRARFQQSACTRHSAAVGALRLSDGDTARSGRCNRILTEGSSFHTRWGLGRPLRRFLVVLIPRASVGRAERAYAGMEWLASSREGDLADRDIGIYPDAYEGIVATFPHQNFNSDPVEGQPWRTGKPCLERPASVFQRDNWAGEPRDLLERLIWHIGRLLSWIDAAAQNELMVDGDPLELPIHPSVDMASLIGFHETTEDFERWISSNQHWGFATISDIPGARATAVVSDFMDPQRRSIKKPSWSIAIPVEAHRADAVWLILPYLIVFEP